MAEKLKLDIDPAWTRFQAKHLHALEPIIRSSQRRLSCWSVAGLMVEPIATGGAVLVVTDGGTLAAIFDPNARASRPLRITVPDELFSAVTPPPGVKMYAPGEPCTVDLPEWAQPGQVYAYALSAMVFGQMPHPCDEGEDYILASIHAEDGNTYAGGFRIHKEPPTLNWRATLAKPRTGAPGRINLYPHILAHFDRIEALFRTGMEMSFGGADEAVILTVPEAPFIGAVMPNKYDIEAPATPAWVTLPPIASDDSLPSAA